MATFRGFSDYPPPLNPFCIMPPHPYRAVGLRVIVLYCQLDAAQYDNATAAERDKDLAELEARGKISIQKVGARTLLKAVK